MESLPSASLEDFQAFVGIVFSAVTYLFDFSSNIATAIEYHHMAEERHYWKIFFLSLLAVMAIAHIANAVIFRFELKKEDQPLKAAYLLPLMQLRRLVQALWRTCSCKGLGNLKAADDKRALYNILGVSLETAPQLFLQFKVFLLYYNKAGGPPPKTLLISIFASFLSGTVNGGLAILAVSRTQTQDISWRVQMVGFIIAGLSTFSALLLKCITSTELLLLASTNSYPRVVYVTMELSFHIIIFMVLLRRRPSASKYALRSYCNGRRVLHCAALGYVAATTGSLQPITSDAKLKDELGKPVYWYRLLLVSTVQLCFYGGLFLLCLVGPSHWRWSTLCPKLLHGTYPDELKDFPCGWHAPATISGMLLYSITILSHILMDSYVNKICIRICPATNKSMHKELYETDDAHDVHEEQEDWDAGKHGQEVQIACEVPRGTLKKITSHGQGEINYIETTQEVGREVESSNGQVELTYETTRDQLLQRSHADQVKINCETTREHVCNHETRIYPATNQSMHKELYETDDAHDVAEEQEDWDAGKHGQEVQIACEVPRGTLKKIRSHGQGEINYIETTQEVGREVESSHGQVELTYETTRDQLMLLQRSHADQVKISCETTREHVCNHETMEYTTTQITCKEPNKLGFPTKNMMRFQEDEQSLQNGEGGMVEMEAGESRLLATKDMSTSAAVVVTLTEFDVRPIPLGHF